MPLVVNGTTIPTNVANSLMVNGVNITQVIANGVAVWTQQLGLSIGWSGNSIMNTWDASNDMGIETSGLNYRYYYFSGGRNYHGSWQSVSPSGIFSGDSLYTDASGSYGLSVSANNIRTVGYYSSYAPTWTTLAANGTFSGSSTAHLYWSYNQYEEFILQTSGGYVRYVWNWTGAFKYAPWIRLN